ncbi:polymorphic toxin type 34 domain-containing protein [Coleofasciculus sp. B1-GNL1-01]|uniref:polymorphic toxin type 34 domain-containing protein n=1 Tax=Coleofasciculus sp. B1-GNL1-01 TaxID=3068484 RepID=UPI004064194C
MPARGNLSDSGILAEAYQLLREGSAKTLCQALDILMRDAKTTRDTARILRIKGTQKAKGCRRSRRRKG